MGETNQTNVSRRTFVRQAGLLAGGMLLGAKAATGAGQQPAVSGGHEGLPRRILGRTRVPVSTLALGTGYGGLCPAISDQQVAEMVGTALDLGINYIETARIYGNAEEGVGLGLGRRRKQAFLVTKVKADTIEDAEQSLSTSLKLLKTDYLDLVHFHDVGGCELEPARGPDGAFTWLVKQKQAGKFRFLGISGHHRPHRFASFIETGEVDVVMMAMNFVDRYTYGFEEKVLPIARKHNLGVVAMKVYGGTLNRVYTKPNQPPQLDKNHLDLALRYALGLPGVAAVNIGVEDTEQLRQNVERVKGYRPLTGEEHAMLAKLGRRLAAQWGEHFGPTAEESG